MAKGKNTTKKNFFKDTGLKTPMEINRDRAKRAKPREGKFIEQLDKLRKGKIKSNPNDPPRFTGKTVAEKPKTAKPTTDFNKGLGDVEQPKDRTFAGQLAWNAARKGVK